MSSANVIDSTNANHNKTSTSLNTWLFVTMEPIWALRAWLTAVLAFGYEVISPPPVHVIALGETVQFLPWIGTRRSRWYNSNINGRFKVEARVNSLRLRINGLHWYASFKRSPSDKIHIETSHVIYCVYKAKPCITLFEITSLTLLT